MVHARLNLAIIALEDRRPHDAWFQAREVLAASPDDPFALALGAVALRLLGYLIPSETMRRRAAAAPTPAFPTADQIDFMRRLDEVSPPPNEDGPAQARRLANEGAYWFRHENVERAERCLRQAIELDPACASAHYYRGVLAAELGRDAIARLCFVKALKADAGCIAAKLALDRLSVGRPVSPSFPA